METFLLTWVPKRYPISKLREAEIVATLSGHPCAWSTGSRKTMAIGDSVFALKQGRHDPGIFGAGHVVSEVYETEIDHSLGTRVVEAGDTSLAVDVLFDTLLDPEDDEILSLEILKSHAPGGFWKARGSGAKVPDNLAPRISKLWTAHLRRIEDAEKVAARTLGQGSRRSIEGNRSLVTHLQAERDPMIVREAKRDWLIADPQLKCACCAMSFRKKYGSRGIGFIEAHHKRPFANLKKGETIITTVKDLVPVCSNCHRMLHKRPAMSVKALADLIVRAGG